MTERVADWIGALDAVYPPGDAEGWDAVGLQVGDPADSVTGVLVCLDVMTATLDEATRRGANLIVAHHPLLFRPLARVTPDSAAGRLALSAARQGLNVVAAHTNFDVAERGTTDPVMQLLGATDVVALVPSPRDEFAKLVVFVPVDDTADVMSAAFAAGAGGIGDYDECSFSVTGTGTFRPAAGANPAVGEVGRRNEVAENRVEMLVSRARVSAVVAAVERAHPYEEVALDVYPLTGVGAGAERVKGLGRVGTLPAPATLRDLAVRLRDELPSPHLRLAGDPDRRVSRIAACGGAGDSLIPAALDAGAEVYITGDLRHHVALDALTEGMALIDAGHYATEAAALPFMVEGLRNIAAEHGLKARLLASETSTEPWVAVSGEEELQR